MAHSHLGHNQEHLENNLSQKTYFKDLLPLFIIFAAVFIFTGISQIWWAQDGGAESVMRNFMAGFFLIFGGFKVINWPKFVEAYRIYDILAKRSLIWAWFYPVLEIALGLAYLFGVYLLATNIVTFVVMIIGSVGVFIELKKGNKIICACLGAVFRVPMTKVTLFEDLLMAVMALGMILLII